MSLAGEWNFIDTTTPMPSANGQMRLNQTDQDTATLLWVSRVTAPGFDATAALEAILQGQQIRIENKSDPSKWQTYEVTGSPVATTAYIQYPVAWQDGGTPVPQQRTNLHAIPPGDTSLPVETLPQMHTYVGKVEVIGHIQRDDLVFPSDGPHGFSPGLTKRQWYAAHAMQGFIASNPNNANMVDSIAPFSFRVADSLLKFEADEASGAHPPMAGGV